MLLLNKYYNKSFKNSSFKIKNPISILIKGSTAPIVLLPHFLVNQDTLKVCQEGRIPLFVGMAYREKNDIK